MEKVKNKIHVTHYTFYQNNKSYDVMKSNLPAEDKRMQKFTKVASGEREKNKFHVTHQTFCQNEKSYEVMKSNLPPERK